MDQYADDLAAASLESLGVARAVVCGLSMGGYIAFAMLRHRDRIRGLVLADTRATADTDDLRANRAELTSLIEQEGMTALAERSCSHPRALDDRAACAAGGHGTDH